MTGSNPRQVAQNLFHYARGNADRIAAIRAAFDASMTGALTKGGMDSLTGAMKNGVNMTRLVGMNEQDRQTALRMASEWLAVGFMPSQSRSFGRF
jgi:hypothetical protein